MRGTTPKITPIPPIASSWRAYDLFAHRYIFTLPPALLLKVTQQVGRKQFDREILDLDERWAKEASRHQDVVGYRDGQPINYPYLNERSTGDEIVSTSEAEWMEGWTPEQVDAANSACDFLASQHNLKISYCGWLMCRPKFRAEHDALVQTYPQIVASGPPEFTEHKFDGGSIMDGDQSATMDRWRAFYARWRINKLVAPGLPDPAGVQWADLGHDFTPAHLRESTRGPRIPDTQMLPNGDSLRALMGDSSAVEHDWHLREWKRLIDPSKPSKKQIERYARLFRLQHYWKALYDRMHLPSIGRSAN